MDFQEHTDIKSLYSKESFIGTQVTVCGWIRHFRLSGGKGKEIAFVRLYDGSCQNTLQIIFAFVDLPEDRKDYLDEMFKRGKSGMSLKVVGLLKKSPAKGQTIELQA